MIYSDNILQLSGLQHFLFCRRQWALIHIEKVWEENVLTVSGQIMHERTHNELLTEKRGDVIITRGMNIFSRQFGVVGKCDVLEFHRSDAGVPINGWDGLWIPYPVEYKLGSPKTNNCDEAQLCAQAMCLEEMLCCEINVGALFYGRPRRRTVVHFTPELRNIVREALKEMHQLYVRGYTPKVKSSKSCNSCSLKEKCLPVLMKSKQTVSKYLSERVREEV